MRQTNPVLSQFNIFCSCLVVDQLCVLLGAWGLGDGARGETFLPTQRNHTEKCLDNSKAYWLSPHLPLEGFRKELYLFIPAGEAPPAPTTAHRESDPEPQGVRISRTKYNHCALGPITTPFVWGYCWLLATFASSQPPLPFFSSLEHPSFLFGFFWAASEPQAESCVCGGVL